MSTEAKNAAERGRSLGLAAELQALLGLVNVDGVAGGEFSFEHRFRQRALAQFEFHRTLGEA